MNSSVYTKPWVVEFMLDLVGYVPGTGISGKTIVEPACGEGSFLGSIARRLAREVQTQRLEWLSIENAVIACDISPQAVQKSAQVVQRTLQCYCCPPLLACKIADSWVQQGDFLTASLRKCSYVVGNPPYIRACEIDASVRDVYLKALPSFTRGCDLYVGFFDKGLDILENDGVLCYICADRWLQNSYGNRLRKKIGSGFDLELLIRMHNIDAFEDSVMAYPAITIIQNRKNISGKFYFVDCKNKLSSDDALKIRTHEGTENLEICELPAPLAGDVYPLGDSSQISRISSIRETLPKIGITTGCDSVFITDNHDIVEDSRLVPLFLMREYRKNRPMRKWLINPWDNSGNLVDLESFPLLKDYLYAHHERLMSRHVARKNASSWYRTIDRIN